jgi:hypothetical protein
MCTSAVPRPPGTIVHDDNKITVRLDLRVYSPDLRQADPPAETAMPLWGGCHLHFEIE